LLKNDEVQYCNNSAFFPLTIMAWIGYLFLYVMKSEEEALASTSSLFMHQSNCGKDLIMFPLTTQQIN
jgi:hypothetical protein